MAEDDGAAMNRRGPARRGGQPALTVRPRRRGQQQAPAIPAPTRDEHDLTPWHYRRGEQVICGTCDMRPCADRCTEQFSPDTLHLKASRANLTIEQWAAAHPDWIGWTLHAEREDVASQALGAGRSALGEPADAEPTASAQDRTPNAEERTPNQRRIPVGAAMEQAMAVMAGQVAAEAVVPVYEEVR